MSKSTEPAEVRDEAVANAAPKKGKRLIVRILLALVGVVLVSVVGIGVFALLQVRAYDASMDKVYDLPLSSLAASTEPAVVARGKHLAESVMGCAVADCHGTDFAGGKTLVMGPLGSMTAPNITKGGLGAVYTDAEIGRLLRHGVKKDGRSLTFMPVQEINWISDEDIIAVISYLRSMPQVDKPNGPMEVGTLAKILDRQEAFDMDVARSIDHANIELAPAPEPTKEYGRFVARLCMGCHGKTFSGGPIPGAPDSMAVPLNLTPHETGLKGWAFEDFERLLDTGVRKSGPSIKPEDMPYESFRNFDATERKAVWAYLESLPPTAFGGR